MAKIPCLHRCGDIWHYRRRVPDKLRSIIGKTEIWKSLYTKDYSTALKRHQTVSGDVAIMFHKLSQQHADGTYDGDFNRDILLHKTSTQSGEFQAPPLSDVDGLRTLIKTVVEEVLEHHAPKKPSITLDDLYRRYMDDPARSRSKKTIMTYQSVYNVLMELFGPDKSIGEITRDDCRKFMNTIRYLPANARKRFPRKSLVEISDIARSKNMKAMAPLTINKYVNKLSAMLNWAVEEELLSHNPAMGLKVADPVHAQDKRLPFSNHQLVKIFTALSDKSGAEFWVPHIGLYNGLRLNEICQLNVEDVTVRDEVWCFNITRETDRGVDDKVLKTKASERIVPIHPELMELGFMQYLKQFERKPRSKLFPDIRTGTTGYRSDQFSKWFVRFLKSIDAYAERTSFHSFRHNFRDALRESNVRHEIAMLLGGWSSKSHSMASQAYYGRGFTMPTLLFALKKITFRL